MKEFLANLTSTWWWILIIVFVALAVWVLLSALLYRRFFKRFYDMLLSGLALIILSPLLLLLMLLGAIKMKGNPFFVQPRPGRINKKTGKERIFKLIKFRTMTCEKDSDGNLLPDEKRLTRYGRLLRSTSLDELPELINIFIGDMSIVGPRPLLVRDMVFMNDEIRRRHLVRGGVTGLAQVNGRNNIAWEKKFEYDLRYIKSITLFKDIAIMVKTVFKVLGRKDVERDGTVSDIDYGDWLLQNGEITEEEYAGKRQVARELIKR